MTEKQQMKIFKQLDEMLTVTNASTIRNMLVALLLAKSERMTDEVAKEETKREAWKVGASL